MVDTTIWNLPNITTPPLTSRIPLSIGSNITDTYNIDLTDLGALIGGGSQAVGDTILKSANQTIAPSTSNVAITDMNFTAPDIEGGKVLVTFMIQGSFSGGGNDELEFYVEDDGTPQEVLRDNFTNANAAHLVSYTYETDANGQVLQLYANNINGGETVTINGSDTVDYATRLAYVVISGGSGGGGGSQTPWLSDIDGNGFDLSNVSEITTEQLSITRAATPQFEIKHLPGTVPTQSYTLVNMDYIAYNQNFEEKEIVDIDFEMTATTAGAENGSVEFSVISNGSLDPAFTLNGATKTAAFHDYDIADVGTVGFRELASVPTTPGAGYGKFYVADNGGTMTPYFLDDAGTSTSLFSGGGGSGSLQDAYDIGSTISIDALKPVDFTIDDTTLTEADNVITLSDEAGQTAGLERFAVAATGKLTQKPVATSFSDIFTTDNTDSAPTWFDISSSYLYSATADGLEIYDVSDPENIAFIQKIDVIGDPDISLRNLTCVRRHGSFVYITFTGGNSDQVTRMLENGVGSGYTTATVTIDPPLSGTTATATANIVGGQIVSYNITNPGSGYTSNPGVTITGDGTGADADALVDQQPPGMAIIDTTDTDMPPEEVQVIEDGETPTGSLASAALKEVSRFVVYGNYGYFPDTSANMITVLDFTDPLQTKVAAALSDGDGGMDIDEPVAVAIYENRLFWSNTGSVKPGIQCANVQDVDITPIAPVQISTITSTTPDITKVGDLATQGNLVYCAPGLAGNATLTGSDDLTILNFDDPTNPSVKSSITVGDESGQMHVHGNYVILPSVPTGAGTPPILTFVDTSDTTTPVIMSSTPNTVALGVNGVYNLGNHLYAGAEATNNDQVIVSINLQGIETQSADIGVADISQLQVTGHAQIENADVQSFLHVGAGGAHLDGKVTSAAGSAFTPDVISLDIDTTETVDLDFSDDSKVIEVIVNDAATLTFNPINLIQGHRITLYVQREVGEGGTIDFTDSEWLVDGSKTVSTTLDSVVYLEVVQRSNTNAVSVVISDTSSSGGGGGANQSLSNLTDPTAINQDLNMGESNAITFQDWQITHGADVNNNLHFETIDGADGEVEFVTNDLDARLGCFDSNFYIETILKNPTAADASTAAITLQSQYDAVLDTGTVGYFEFVSVGELQNRPLMRFLNNSSDPLFTIDLDSIYTAAGMKILAKPNTTAAGLNVGELSETDRDSITNTANGDIIYNSTDGELNYITGATTWREVVSADGSQTLTNKTLSSPTFSGTASGTLDFGSTGGLKDATFLEINSGISDGTLFALQHNGFSMESFYVAQSTTQTGPIAYDKYEIQASTNIAANTNLAVRQFTDTIDAVIVRDSLEKWYNGPVSGTPYLDFQPNDILFKGSSIIPTDGTTIVSRTDGIDAVIIFSDTDAVRSLDMTEVAGNSSLVALHAALDDEYSDFTFIPSAINNVIPPSESIVFNLLEDASPTGVSITFDVNMVVGTPVSATGGPVEIKTGSNYAWVRATNATGGNFRGEMQWKKKAGSSSGGGGSSESVSILCANTNNNGIANNVGYWAFSGSANESTSEVQRTVVIPFDCTISDLYTTFNTNGTITFTIMKNGAATSLETVYTNETGTKSDLANSETFSAGDTISLRSNNTGGNNPNMRNFSVKVTAS